MTQTLALLPSTISLWLSPKRWDVSPKENESRLYTCTENYIRSGKKCTRASHSPAYLALPPDLQISYQGHRGRTFMKGMGEKRVLG